MNIEVTDELLNGLKKRSKFINRKYGAELDINEIACRAISKYLNRKKIEVEVRETVKRYRIRLWKSQKHKCYLCDKPKPLAKFTVDHIVPMGRGGSATDPNNMAGACRHCNAEKGMLLLDEYKRIQLLSDSK